ncbi:MAG: hypothetical protein IH606_19360 [Burkholderiales bacterium]|nr:hypothetical protein [Burkholderiales bacterium]
MTPWPALGQALGVAFAVLAFLVKGPICVYAGTMSGWLRSHPSVLTWVYRSSGANFAGLTVTPAFERR